MSGVEVAGLVLGALPVLVEAIKVYADGVSTAERYLKYEIPLRRIHRALGAEYIIYLNTCEEVLNGVVHDNDERAELLEVPGGPAWKKPELEKRLEERLLRSYSHYVGTMEEMQKAVEEIKKLVKLGPEGKAQFNAATKFRKEYHRLRFSLRKQDYDGIVLQLQQHNQTLRTLTQQALALEPRRSRSAHKLPDLGVIQRYAACIYKNLCSRLKCSCQTSHGLNLCLERISDCTKGLPATLPSLRVLLSYSSQWPLDEDTPWSLEAIDIRPVGNSPISETQSASKLHKQSTKSVRFQPPDNESTSSHSVGSSPSSRLTTMSIRTESPTVQKMQPTEMKDLCKAMCKENHEYANRCVGVFEESCNQQKLGLYKSETKALIGSTKPALLPLRSLLRSGTMGNRRFSTLHRLRVAVLLSSGILQLHHTPWHNDTWDNDDIYFLEAGDADHDVLKEPFITRPSAEELQEEMCSRHHDSRTKGWYGILNHSIFALGILLLELSLGKTLAELRQNICGPYAGKGKQKSGDPESHGSNEISDFIIAERLLDDVFNESGPDYSDAVRRCIRCSFDTRKIDLEDKQFRQAVYDGVVSPLEKALRRFEQLEV